MAYRPSLPHHYGGTAFPSSDQVFGNPTFSSPAPQKRVAVSMPKSGISPLAKALWEGVAPSGYANAPSFQKRARVRECECKEETQVYPFRAHSRGAIPRRAMEGESDCDDGESHFEDAESLMSRLDFSALQKKLSARFSRKSLHSDDLLLLALVVTLAQEGADKVLLFYLAFLFFTG